MPVKFYDPQKYLAFGRARLKLSNVSIVARNNFKNSQISTGYEFDHWTPHGYKSNALDRIVLVHNVM